MPDVYKRQPQNGDTWGDYARTVILQDGVVVDLDEIENMEWKQGLLMEEFLHHELTLFARPETTFEALYYNKMCIRDREGMPESVSAAMRMIRTTKESRLVYSAR